MGNKYKSVHKLYIIVHGDWPIFHRQKIQNQVLEYPWGWKHIGINQFFMPDSL